MVETSNGPTSEDRTAAAVNNNGAHEESSEAFDRVKAPPVCNDSELKKDAMSAETLQQWVFPDDAQFPSATSSASASTNNSAVTRISSSGWSRSSIASAGGTSTCVPGSGSSMASGGPHGGVGSHNSSSSQFLPSGSGHQPKVPVSIVSVSSNNSCGDSHAAFSSDELHLETTHQHQNKAFLADANNDNDNNNMKPPPPDVDLNAKVALRKSSRQGRSSQRWFNSNDSIAGHSESAGGPIRLVTGCVPILQDGRIMFVSSSRKPAWILPKGGWESDEKMEESAVRECFEEAGCLGTLGPALTPVLYETRKAKKRRLELEQQQKSAKSPRLSLDHHNPTVTAEAHPVSKEDKAKEDSSVKPDGDANGATKAKEGVSINTEAANGSNVETSLHVASETTEKVTKTFSSTTTKATTATTTNSGFTTMSAETISRIRSSSNHQADETMSVGSTLSTTYSQVQMTLFPLYVREIKVEWPEEGRFRRAVPIDEAIAMMESRPEFRTVLLEVKERGLHTVPTTTASSAPSKESKPTPSETATNGS